MQFCAPIHGPEGYFEIWVQTAAYRNGERIYADSPELHDKSVGIRVLVKEELLKAISDHPDGIQVIKPALEAYLNTLEASLAEVGIEEEHLPPHEEHTSYSDRFYWHVLLNDSKLHLKVVQIEQFNQGGGDGRGVMHHLKLSGVL